VGKCSAFSGTESHTSLTSLAVGWASLFVLWLFCEFGCRYWKDLSLESLMVSQKRRSILLSPSQYKISVKGKKWES